MAPVRVAESFDTYYPIAPDWILFTLLIVAGNLVDGFASTQPGTTPNPRPP